MSNSSRSRLLEEEIELLVRHFGVQRVRSAVERFAGNSNEASNAKPHVTMSSGRKPTQPPVATALEQLRESDPEKHRLLSEFLTRLRDRKTLTESQDLRHFAQIIGLKDLQGKSRKDMIPPLMRFLLERSAGKLRIDIQHADSISEQQRQEGFSVLTDKLLGEG